MIGIIALCAVLHHSSTKVLAAIALVGVVVEHLSCRIEKPKAGASSVLVVLCVLQLIRRLRR